MDTTLYQPPKPKVQHHQWTTTPHKNSLFGGTNTNTKTIIVTIGVAVISIKIQTYRQIKTHKQFNLKRKFVFQNISEIVFCIIKKYHSNSNSFHTFFT